LKETEMPKSKAKKPATPKLRPVPASPAVVQPKAAAVGAPSARVVPLSVTQRPAVKKAAPAPTPGKQSPSAPPPIKSPAVAKATLPPKLSPPAVKAQPPVKAQPSAKTPPAVRAQAVAKPAAAKSAARAPEVKSAGAAPQSTRATAETASPVVKSLAPRAIITTHLPPPPKPAQPKGADTYVLEDQVGFRLRKAHQRATNIFTDLMAEFDVTPTQFAALAKLDDLGAISQNQLGRLTAMDPATILGVVGRLHRSGWLRARPSLDDQRLMLIELTAEGQARVGAMKVAAIKVTQRTLAPLNAEEAKTLNALLARLG
jgi:DNA-binding MarR family transcriptional regulator